MSQFTLKSTGETGIGKEAFSWKAIYNDGTSLFQYDDETLEFHQFKEIDQDKLRVFQMFRSENQAEGDTPVLSIMFEKGMKLIHFYKRYHLDVGGADTKMTLYVCGYEKDNGKVLFVITPLGEVIATEDVANLQVG